MFRHVLLIFMLFVIKSEASVLYRDLLSKLPRKQTIVFSGYKYLVGKLVFSITVTRETRNYMVINNVEEVYIVGIKAHKSRIDTFLTLRGARPAETIYWDLRKKKMRFNFFFDDYYRYVRITNFQSLIQIDNDGKIISPEKFNPRNHDIKKSKHPYGKNDTLIFDPNLILVALPFIDRNIEKKLKKTKLIFTTMDHVVPFKLRITGEDANYRYIEIEYHHKKAKEMQLLFKKIVVDKKKKLLKKVSGSEKRVGSVYVELKKHIILER